MSTSGVAAPPRAKRPPVALPDPRPPSTQRYFRTTPSSTFAGAYRWFLLATVLFHLLLLQLAPHALKFELPPGAMVRPAVTVPGDVPIEIVFEIPAAPVAPAPALAPAAGAQTIVPPVGGAAGVAGGPPQPIPRLPDAGGPGAAPIQNPGGPTGAPTGAQPNAPRGDGIRPGYQDSRLYTTPSPFPGAATNLTDLQIYTQHLQARIDAVNDSIAADANRNRNTRDWMLGRWGLADDGLHLGGITIPRALVPNIAPTGDNQTRGAIQERQRQRDEIIRQEEERERARTREERTEATREAEERRRATDAEN